MWGAQRGCQGTRRFKNFPSEARSNRAPPPSKGTDLGKEACIGPFAGVDGASARRRITSQPQMGATLQDPRRGRGVASRGQASPKAPGVA